ncbi:thioesterase [Bacillus pseudomycoides]|uniref:thioesterase II family protein n=1 Tax=Bacillus TaxID=1386 RepID=UPI0003666DDB|nr:MULTISPECIES: alpha/beta fold hydrolase [Bacillus]PDX99223.1 thioesterase [Bacillus pseudomycoides]PEK80737.1 thioesterase [Bacillus pseudomycoides]PEN08119.1 thioesterase [Bacillus pseudomycoides]PGB87538.1 thioesterase [Bacillus pseudomycoides]PGS04534.1 thioesterase [Bacillus pseudomycoides]
MKLFCLPHAGASANRYYSWTKYLTMKDIDIIPLELAGRGKRNNIEHYASLEDAIEDIYINILNLLNDEPYIIVGHSFGSLLAFKLAERLTSNNDRLPRALILSGGLPPQIPRKEIIHSLPDFEFIMKVNEFGEVPEELIEDKHLREIFLPILRNDIRLLETYPRDNIKPLNIDLFILNGSSDNEIKKEYNNLLLWEQLTLKKCKFHFVSGGHFFIFDNTNDVISFVQKIIQEYRDETSKNV